MARLVRPGGKAIGVEHIQELVDKSINNIKKNNKDLFDEGEDDNVDEISE